MATTSAIVTPAPPPDGSACPSSPKKYAQTHKTYSRTCTHCHIHRPPCPRLVDEDDTLASRHPKTRQRLHLVYVSLQIPHAERVGKFELYMHIVERRVRPAQEVECLEDDEAGYDGIGRDDGRDDVVRHFCAYQWRVLHLTEFGGGGDEIERPVDILVKRNGIFASTHARR